MSEGASVCNKSKMRNTVKMAILAIIAMVLFLYIVLFFTGRFSEEPIKLPAKSTDPAIIELAQKTIKTLLTENKTGFVGSTNETPRYFEIKVDGSSWKKQAVDDKKKFLKDISTARANLGLNPNIKIRDMKNNVEYASFENGRASLRELDL